MIHFLFEFITINHLSAKETAFASSRDLGKTNSSCTEVWLLPKCFKIILDSKEDKLGDSGHVFIDSNVNITIKGKRHLYAVIGCNENREEYVKNLVNDWNNQLVLWSSIAESQTQATYSPFVSGFKCKLNYFMRTTQGISQFLYPLEETVRKKLITATTGGLICNNNIVSSNEHEDFGIEVNRHFSM